jgi:type I restriction-modification system DNA methylase subunit
MNAAALQPQLQQPYRRETWQALLPELLPGVEVFVQPHDFPLTSERERTIAKARRQFGTAKLADGKQVAFYEIDVAPKVDLLRNRVALRELVARCIDEVKAHAVLAFFVQPGNKAYRLTYAAKESKLGDDLKLHTEQTATRRFTYVLGPGETRRTAAQRLGGLAEDHAAATLADVTDAFSVEKLNKEFFDTYKQHYLKFCAHLIENTDAPAKVFGLQLRGLDEKARDHALKPVRDFVKKLLGRLVFLHFLQKKGWLGCPAGAKNWKDGDPDFLRQLFNAAPESDRKRFHSRRLVPLFFDTLNNPRRKDELFAITGTRVPYLNGGLFERDFDGVERMDFPAELFAGLLEFFGQYNFTIDENDPDDHEIGIDPEMLGHIFENLLEDNKDKGAYYTPKAVVQYMCQQSLIHALAGHFPGDEAARAEIERLIRRKEPIDPKKDSWLAAHATALEKILHGLNICDPAIGSGAFPIGLLQEIYWTKLTLHPALDRADAKRAIIQRSIHGVDIDAGAVEIARLRFWLALIVEEKNPVPLPNLDYQIMQGNSLLESFEGFDLSRITEPDRVGVTLLGSDQVELGLGRQQVELAVGSEPQESLAALQQKYFLLHDAEAKAQLRHRIDRAVLRAIDAQLERRRDELETSLAQEAAFVRGRKRTPKEEKKREATRAKLAALADKKAKLHALLEDPHAERPFFLWHLWFRHVLDAPPKGRGGFDIVIANPPYVRHETISDFRDTLANYETAASRADLFVFFFEAGVRLLHPEGVFCFIASNKYFRAAYGAKLRKFLAEKTAIHRIVDFGDTAVFKAISYASILLARREDTAAHNRVRALVWSGGADLENLWARVEAQSSEMPQSALKVDGWNFSTGGSGLLEKLQAASTPLRKYVGGRCYRGVITGLNEAFVIDEATRRRLIAEDKKSAELIRPWLRGRDVKRWQARWANLYAIVFPFGFHTKLGNYPAVLRHLKQFETELRKRGQCTSSRGGKDEGQHHWLELDNNPRPSYLEEFTRPKVIIPAIERACAFAYDDEGYFSNDKTTICVSNNARFLCAVLNSSVIWWVIRQIAAERQNGYYEFKPMYVNRLPIPTASAAEQAALSGLVERVLAAKRGGAEAEVERLEAEIDERVYRLYGLTEDERKIVEGVGGAK